MVGLRSGRFTSVTVKRKNLGATYAWTTPVVFALVTSVLQAPAPPLSRVCWGAGATKADITPYPCPRLPRLTIYSTAV